MNVWEGITHDQAFKSGFRSGYASAQHDATPDGADPGWLRAHRELLALHVEKSATYGTDADRFANFTAVAANSGAAPEYYPLLRIMEKAQRALIMIGAGQELDVREYPDMASLAIICEALRRRRA